MVPPLLSLFPTCPCADDGLIWVGFFLMKFPSLMMMMDRVSFSGLLSVTYKRNWFMRPPKRVLTCRDFGIPKTKNEKNYLYSFWCRSPISIDWPSFFLSSFLFVFFFFFFSVSSRFLSPWRHYRLFNVFFSRLLAPKRGKRRERERRPVEVLDYI